MATKSKVTRSDLKSRSIAGSGNSRLARIKAVQGKWDEGSFPSYIDIDGKLYSGGSGFGDKKRAEEEVSRDKQFYGEAFIVVLNYYRVYHLDAKETEDTQMLREKAKGSGKEADIAKHILKFRSGNITKI